ncbi:polysaccharide pyruvyl transferase family protein [Butyrivibrio sp. AE3004]|uniref:polysaccharide pyruvyl transferase family protein n=1 Tax=Butyrivibrio sp. AE3004 TaxID=1506994 RepID=UPI0004940D53|nr:polysaccharide pyruvyl transferase family protein [Butyrivibrio sp. AE3004]
MKIGVITRHAITNYGSLLQAFATQTAIEELGYDCEIIDYIRMDEAYKNVEKTLLRKKNSWNKNLLSRFIYLLLRQPESVIAGSKFEKQRKKYLKLTRNYSSKAELIADCPKTDVYMTGSDQVWGPVSDGTYDDVYCLSFAENKKRIAYAASFGHTDMTGELKDYFSKHLKKYNSISVREDSAVNILKDIGQKAEQVVDPTLLFDSHFWSKYAKEINTEKYLLVYQLHNDKNLGRYAETIAKKKGLKLIRVSASLHQITRSGKFVWCPSVAEFLGYIKNAELMVTDSFHGTAFAITFNTPFIEVLPNNNTGTRNVSILNMTNLSERILTDNSKNLEDISISFDFANRILRQKRAESKEILKKMISE